MFWIPALFKQVLRPGSGSGGFFFFLFREWSFALCVPRLYRRLRHRVDKDRKRPQHDTFKAALVRLTSLGTLHRGGYWLECVNENVTTNAACLFLAKLESLSLKAGCIIFVSGMTLWRVPASRWVSKFCSTGRISLVRNTWLNFMTFYFSLFMSRSVSSPLHGIRAPVCNFALIINVHTWTKKYIQKCYLKYIWMKVTMIIGRTSRPKVVIVWYNYLLLILDKCCMSVTKLKGKFTHLYD